MPRRSRKHLSQFTVSYAMHNFVFDLGAAVDQHEVHWHDLDVMLDVMQPTNEIAEHVHREAVELAGLL